MPISRFTPSGWNHTPVYLCGLCGKRTRDTGAGEGPVELCKRCYATCTADNDHSDHGAANGHTDEGDCPTCKRIVRDILKPSKGV